MTHKAPQKLDWNVVASAHEDGFREARLLLGDFGKVAPSEFHNVLVMKVEDPEAFAEALAGRLAQEPGLLNFVSRVVPTRTTFDFQDVAEFEAKAEAAVLALVPELAGRSFHVRVHRRGFRHRLSGHEEERRLGMALLDALTAAGRPGRLAFDDPDAIVVIETVGQRAGVSHWTREQRQRYAFLRLD